MKLREIMQKIRKADKVEIKDDKGNELFRGFASQCELREDLHSRTVKELHPEMFGWITVIVKK